MQAQEIFLLVFELPEPQRTEKLARLCGDDNELLRDVESLLAAHGNADSFLAHPTVNGDARNGANGPSTLSAHNGVGRFDADPEVCEIPTTVRWRGQPLRRFGVGSSS